MGLLYCLPPPYFALCRAFSMFISSLGFVNLSTLKSSGHFMYHQWSLYVPHIGHYMHRTVVTICITSFSFSSSTFCPHSVFMCFVWISEQTAIISLYSINWLVCITETVCLLRGTDWFCIHNSDLTQRFKTNPLALTQINTNSQIMSASTNGKSKPPTLISNLCCHHANTFSFTSFPFCSYHKAELFLSPPHI